MSWAAVGNFLKSRWVKEQSPIVVVLFVLLIAGYDYIFNRAPEIQRENRETWKQIRGDMQSGFDKNLSEFRSETREWRLENKEQRETFERVNGRLIESMFNMKQQQEQTINMGDALKNKRIRDQLVAKGLLQETQNGDVRGVENPVAGAECPEAGPPGGAGGPGSGDPSH